MKRCTKCGELRPLDQFYAAKGTRDGLRGDCKLCFQARAKARYPLVRDRAIARARQWQLENPERYRATLKRLRSTPEYKRRARNQYLMRKYGVTVDEYDELLAAQGGVCAICGRPPRDDISLHLDHDHTTGERRGLLCFKCNNALGDFDDDPERLLRAYVYLTPALWKFEGAESR
jgi:hypothetical protein